MKNRDSFRVPVITLSSQVLDTKPLKYSLHQSLYGKNKFLKGKVTLEEPNLKPLAASLYNYVE